jgi:glycosyltransferase involved in cell wall biosynthesis
MNNELVSVVVPIYGIEKYISKCIKSILAQSYLNIEIILINDGSPDKCGEICKKFLSLDKRIKYFYKTNGGLVSARKKGVKHASGKYITFVDGDDFLEKDHLQNLYFAIKKDKSDLSISGFTRYFFGKKRRISNKISPGTYDLKKDSFVLDHAIYNKEFFEHGITTYVWNKLFLLKKLKSVIRSVDDKIVMGEDSCITYPYLFACKRISVISSNSYIYRQRQDSIIKNPSNFNKETKKISLVFNHLKKTIPQTPINKKQVYFYKVALLLIRLGGARKTSKNFLKIYFENIQKDDRNLSIVSSGSFGQAIVNNIYSASNFQLISWHDDDWKESQLCGLEVESMEGLKHKKFDKVLIASIDQKYISILRDKLISLGISDNRISSITRFPEAFAKDLSLRM